MVDWLAATLSSPPATVQALVSIASAGRAVSEIEQLGALQVLQACAHSQVLGSRGVFMTHHSF